jgi:hypothetical protein
MNSAVRKFSFGASVRSPRSSFLWLTALVLVGAWSGEFNLFWIALICGTSLDFLHRFTPWKGRVTARLLAFFGPVVLVSVVALFLDERTWLKPLWVVLAVFFGGIILGSLGCAELGEESLTLRSFAVFRLRIPYQAIESIEPRTPSDGSTRVRLAFSAADETSPGLKEQFLQFADDDAQEFVREVTRRARLSHAPAS